MTRTPTYPGYDVLAKRDTPSWDAPTRAVIDARVSTPDRARYLGPSHWQTLVALCDTIVPQPGNAHGEPAPRVPVAALVEGKLVDDRRDGFRDARLPPLRTAWETGLAALDAESVKAYGEHFAQLQDERRRALVARMQRGELRSRAWRTMPCDVFFKKRVLHDVSAAYWSHPLAWSAMGFGGPANPRGYVRLYTNRRDPWEAVEAADESDAAHEAARRENERVR
ncbi:gluconate 2-dehydrogenase subunit 3 family protein [Paraburkholderia sp. EG286B]|uniref:gluconate 2-dehydrogenase subunit 3 family protein n=1 Tax=Paraburkholderia sp. EG286B TaxID=3237011 RepID=UPI0034D30560